MIFAILASVGLAANCYSDCYEQHGAYPESGSSYCEQSCLDKSDVTFNADLERQYQSIKNEDKNDVPAARASGGNCYSDCFAKHGHYPETYNPVDQYCQQACLDKLDVTFDADAETMYQAIKNEEKNEVPIPASVTSLGGSCYSDCYKKHGVYPETYWSPDKYCMKACLDKNDATFDTDTETLYQAIKKEDLWGRSVPGNARSIEDRLEKVIEQLGEAPRLARKSCQSDSDCPGGRRNSCYIYKSTTGWCE